MKKNNFIDLYLDYFDRNFKLILLIIAVILVISMESELNPENKKTIDSQKEELINQISFKDQLKKLEDHLNKKQINHFYEKLSDQ